MSVKYTLDTSQKLDLKSEEGFDTKFQKGSITEKTKQNDWLSKEYESLIQDDSNLHPSQSISKTIEEKAQTLKVVSADFQSVKSFTSSDEKLENKPKSFVELQNFLQVRIQSDIEKVDEISDDYPLLETRKAVYRIMKSFSEFFKILTESVLFQVIVTLVILFNTIVLAMEDPKWTSTPYPYDIFEFFFVYFYTCEFGMIVLGHGLFMHSDSYFRSWWNLLDFTILVTAWLNSFAGSGFVLNSLRSLRILRPLRTISSVKGLKALFLAIVNSLKPFLSALLILFFFILIFAIAGVQFWSGNLLGQCMNFETGIYDNSGNPCGSVGAGCKLGFVCVKSLQNPDYGVTDFDNILIALVTTYQIITLENWSVDMVYTQQASGYYVFIYYMPLVFVAALILLNFVQAIIAVSFLEVTAAMNNTNFREYEKLSDAMLQAIYHNTTGNYSDLSKSDEKQKTGEKQKVIIEKPEKKNVIYKKIHFEKKIKKNKKPKAIFTENFGEYENENDPICDIKHFKPVDIVENISITSQSVRNNSRLNPIYYKRKTSETLGSKLFEGQATMNKGYLTMGKVETNQIITDINPDSEGQVRKRKDYDKLKGVVSIKSKTLNQIKKNPRIIKNSRLVLLESFKIESESSFDVFPAVKPKFQDDFGTFSYIDPECESLLHNFYNENIRDINEKFSEFNSKFERFNYLWLRFRMQGFYLMSINVKEYVLETTQNYCEIRGNWSGYDVMTDKNDKHEAMAKKMSMMKYRLWSMGYVGYWEKLKYPLKVIILHKYSNYITMLAVLINTGALAYDHYQISSYDAYILESMNTFFTYFFTAEVVLKFILIGPIEFLRDAMNYFDTIVVAVSLIEVSILTSGTSAISALRAIRIFRIFRVMRIVKIFRYLKSMNHILRSLSASLVNSMYLFLLLLLFQVIFTLLNMQVFGGQFNFPNGLPYCNFENFNWAFVTTVQLLSTENWNDILTAALRSQVGPASCILLIVWIIIGNYMLLNLVLAILLNSFGEDEEADGISIENLKANSKIKNKLKVLEDFHDSDSESSIKDEIKLKLSIYDRNQCVKSFFIFGRENPLRVMCCKINNSMYFEWGMLFIIFCNSLKLVWDTYILNFPSTSNEVQISMILDDMFTGLFMLEFVIKSIALGFVLDEGCYLRDPWNILDFGIVVVSIVDLSVSSFNLPIIKLFRLLRTLRPLKLIKHNPSMRIIVTAILESLVSISNVLILIVIIWVMYAIIGVSLLAGKMYSCSNPNLTTIQECIDSGYTWVNTASNFDNVSVGMIVLFVVMSQESWPNRMLEGINAGGVGVGPIHNHNVYMGYYYIVYLVIANFFMLNLFTVVIFEKFNEAKRNESSISVLLLNKEQLTWAEIQKLILTAKPGNEIAKVPSNKFRKIMFNIAKSKKLEVFIFFVITINLLVLAMPYPDASQSYIQTLDYINLVCTFIFISEACVKIIGLGTSYFKSAWNKFDFSIALISLLDVIIVYALAATVPFLRSGPQIIRIIRVLRVSRLFRLFKAFEMVQQLLLIIIYSIPAIANITALLSLVYFIYAILGSFLFHPLITGMDLNRYWNFQNFNYSLMILWRISTGEDYPIIMWDCTLQSGSYFYVLFFLSFVSIIDFVILEIFVSIILQNYEEFSRNPDSSLSLFTKDFKIFKKYWAGDNQDSRAYKINKNSLITFMSKIGKEFGFINDVSHLTVVKFIGSLNIEMDTAGYSYFHDVLFAVLKRKYGKKLEKRGLYVLKAVRMEEFTTKKALAKLKENYEKRLEKASNAQNLFMNTILVKGVFKNWKNYTVKAKQGDDGITPQFSDIEYPGENSIELEETKKN